MGNVFPFVPSAQPVHFTATSSPSKPWFPSLSCKMDGNTTPCSLAHLNQTDYTMVYPGGDTMCMWGTPYGFLVRPGAADKLLISFQSGGGCFGAGEWAQMCTKWLSFDNASGIGGPPSGILNTSNQDNPFYNYTLVLAMYCDGGVFGSNATIKGWPRPPIKGNLTEDAQMRGYYNGRATLDWVKRNVPGKLQHLFVSGDSAGAVAAMLWAKTILNELQYEFAGVVADSFAGVFPEEPFAKLIQEYGYCDLPLAGTDELVQMCRDSKISAMHIFNDTLRTFASDAKVSFGAIQSKYDFVQMLYYTAMAVTFLDVTQVLIPVLSRDRNIFYGKTLDFYKEYNKNHNFKVYFVSSTMHTYTEENNVYSASTASWNTEGGSGKSMLHWLSEFKSQQTTKTDQCDGRSPRRFSFFNWPTCHPKFDTPSDCTGYCLSIFK